MEIYLCGILRMVLHPSENNPMHAYADTGWYMVTLYTNNMNGCPDTFRLNVRVNESFQLFVPNGFTPNGDGINEYFYPKGTGIDFNKYDFQIYNRWGEKIFESTKYGAYWNGTVKNTSHKAKEDVYVYKINVADISGRSHVLHGHVSLIR